MTIRRIDDELVLIPYYPNEAVALRWYQDADVCKQCDNIDYVYTPERLNAMYTYLSTHGDCFYIQYRGLLVGDCTLRHDAERRRYIIPSRYDMFYWQYFGTEAALE